MRSIGDVRRIDDFGRVVLPKVARRQLNLENGDLLESFIHDDFLCLRRQSSAESCQRTVNGLVSSLESGCKDVQNREEILSKLKEILDLFNDSSN